MGNQGIDPGIIDQNIQAAVVTDDLVKEIADLLRISEISLDVDCIGIGLGQGLAGFGRGFGMKGDRQALLGQLVSDRLANSRG